jgi:ATP-binding cassette, subfamily B, bacterial
VSEAEGQATALSQSLRAHWQFARFAYDTLIAPWPIFIFLLAIVGLIGGVTPLIEIKAMSGLVNALTAHAPTFGGTNARSLFVALAPYLTWVLLLVGIRIVSWTIYMESFQRYLAVQLNERVRARFDPRFYGHALALRLEWFETPSFYDTLARARRSMDDEAVAVHLTHLQRLVSMVLGALAILWALGRVHWAIPLVLLSGSLLLIAWHVRREREFIEINFRQTPLQRQRDYWRDLITRRATAAEVRLFDLGAHIMRVWRGLTGRALEEISTARRRNVRRALPVLAANIALFGLVGLALIYQAAHSRLSAGALVALLYAAQSYLDRLHMISWRIETLQRFFGGLRSVPRFFALAREESASGATAPIVLRDCISFANVGFTYPGSAKPALAEINLHIRPGERLALVGENGAGKSTLAKLLLGLYRPTEGAITIDGIDLQTIAPQAWRALTGAVLQDFMRYELTMRENIGLGELARLDDLAAIEQAARLSSAAAFVEHLPARYETMLGRQFEGGQDLSTGQWQKLALARLYLRDPVLVVLDEPTAALDAHAELELYRRFLHIAAGKTVLVISHRLGSARLCDRILFLQHGRIVQAGTHDELLARGGPYAELYELQAQWYRDAEGTGELQSVE